MREYFAALKRNANAWGSPMSALVHHPDARTAWIIGMGLALTVAAIVAWHYSSTPLLTSAQPQPSSTSLSINPLPAASLPDITASADMTAGTGSSGGSSSAQVTVNNHAVPVPSNGSVHTVVKQGDATTHIDVSSSTNTLGSSSSSSSLTVNVDSSSDAESGP